MNKKAFSLLEVLIALFIGAMIMSQLLEGMRQAAFYLKRGIECSTIDRTVAFLFNQLERDLTAAFIPYTYEKEKDKKKEGDKKDDEKKFRSLYKFPFLARIDEEAMLRRVGGKKREQFSLLSFITTTPLELYIEKKPRVLRVGYYLKSIVSRNPAIPQTYTLIRKETLDCSNERFQVNESAQKENKKKITEYILAENIKALSLQFSTPKPKDPKRDKEKKLSQEEKTITSYAWGETEKTKELLPKLVEVYCELWNPTYTRTSVFTCSFPIFAAASEPFPLSEELITSLNAPAQTQAANENNPQTSQSSQPSRSTNSVNAQIPALSALGGKL